MHMKTKFSAIKIAFSAVTVVSSLAAGAREPNYSTALIDERLGYVRRGGAHGISGHDWKWMLDFADRALGR